MGILNVTPDSFSDGGRYIDREAALAHARNMLEHGADIVDIGGASTRPGADEVSAEEEAERVIPVIKELAATTGAVISVDTMKACVAGRAMEAGACIINDVSALMNDPDMACVGLESGAGVVLMHMQGAPRTMQVNPRYRNVVEEVAAYLRGRVDALVAEGFDRRSLAVDPGIGFGKTVGHNISLIKHLDAVLAIGVPLVMGLSRKSFLGKLTGREVGSRLAASLAGLVFCVSKGAQIMRVHDVAASLDAIRVVAALEEEHGVLD